MIEDVNLLQTEIEKLKEKIKFLEEIVDNVPAFIYINQVDTIGDTSTMYNVWGNKYYHEGVKYSREEINSLGFESVKINPFFSERGE